MLGEGGVAAQVGAGGNGFGIIAPACVPVHVALMGILERFVVVSAKDDVSVRRQLHLVDIIELGAVKRFEHDSLVRGVCANDIVGVEHQLVDEIDIGDHRLVQDFEHDHVVGEGVHHACNLCPQEKEVVLFFFEFCGVVFAASILVSATGAV